MTKTKEQEEVPPTKTNEKKENNQISYRQDFKEYIGLEHLAEKRDVDLRRIEQLLHRMCQPTSYDSYYQKNIGNKKKKIRNRKKKSKTLALQHQVY